MSALIERALRDNPSSHVLPNGAAGVSRAGRLLLYIQYARVARACAAPPGHSLCLACAAESGQWEYLRTGLGGGG